MIGTKTITVAACVALAVAAPAGAQDISADPTYETVRLDAGFEDDPYLVELQAGGSMDASDLGGACTGLIADAPDVRLIYSSGSLPLILGNVSESDTTIVVNGPDGRWYCDDDGGEGVDPLLVFDEPQSGQYDIWVGTYADADLADSVMFITEIID